MHHGKHMKHLLIVTGSLAAGLMLAGTPVQSLLPFAIVLVCPLMMAVMMRGMGGHGSGERGTGGHGSGGYGHEHHRETEPQRAPADASPSGTIPAANGWLRK